MLPVLIGSPEIFAEEEKKSTEEKKKGGVVLLPIFFYTPETKMAAGLGGMYYYRTSENKPKARPSSIWMALIYTQKKQFLIDLTPDIYLKDEEFHLTGNVGFYKFPNKFFGIGSDSSEDSEESYTSQTTRFRMDFFKKMQSDLKLGIRYIFEHNKIVESDETGVLAKREILGSKGGTNSGIGVVMAWDSRDNIFFPSSGNFYQMSATFFNRSLSSDYNFNRFNLDYRRYFSLLSTHILAFQGYVNIHTGDPPFQMMSLMGGQYIMRGYYEGRYRDKNMIVFQAEYRIMPVWWKLGIVGFVGFGDVSDSLGHFKLKNFKHSLGFGLRYLFNQNDKFNIRLDFGFGKNSSGFYVTVNEAF